MSKPIKPVAIGIFTLGALVLLITAIFIFGGGQLLNKNVIQFVIFFDSSLNGLDVGAPVKMQGVKIGSVSEIILQLDSQSGKVYKPVVIEIDRNSFMESRNHDSNETLSVTQQKINRDNLVSAGFRARLEVQSLLTGLLYIDFDRHFEAPIVYTGIKYKNLLELPAVPTSIDELRNTVGEVTKRLSSLPLEDIFRDTSATMKDIKKLLESEEIQQSRFAMAKTLQGLEKTVSILNHNLEPLFQNTNKTVVNASALINDSRKMVQDVHKSTRPILSSADQALIEATATLKKTRDLLVDVSNTLKGVDETLGPDSTVNEMLQSVNKTARSIKELTDYLERHPESILSGKDQ